MFDLDGTILMDSHDIHPKNLEAIRLLLERGKEIVFASGRMLPSITKLLRRYFDREFSLIAYNGSVVWIENKGKILDIRINPETAEEVVKVLRILKIHRQAYINDKLVVEEENDFAKAYSDHSQIELTVVPDLAEAVRKNAPTKILAIDSPERLEPVIPKLRESFPNLSIFKSFENYLDFVPFEINKGRALQILAREKNWNLYEAAAFGDNDNDIPLLMSVKVKVAVNNATRSLKEVADFVTEDNTKGGPGTFIIDMFERGIWN
ncbi:MULTISPECIES: Cof-type HAD-IIB family hydrolase [Pseudothermotoga]|uniref:Cof-type HAD-IIB family hydrolase n=1 Tax=Pseudothermotoga TaxID=1643951 RepID=UPI002493239E|nr:MULTISPECIES: Cof-type HAD-IIB family hydrolase [Pseudothermotoga]